MVVDFFFKIESIQGELSKKNYQGEIDIILFDFGVVQYGLFYIGGVGGGFGKVEILDICIQKEVDKFLLLLFKVCVLGKYIKEVIIYFQKVGDGLILLIYYKIKFEDIIVFDIYNNGVVGGDVIMELVMFNCVKVIFDYQVQNVSGGKDGGVVIVYYDICQNEVG